MINIKNPLFPVIISSLYLIFYTAILHLSRWTDLIYFLYFLSPFVVMWMVVRVLKGNGPRNEEPFPYE